MKYYVVEFEDHKSIVVPGTKDYEVVYHLRQHWIFKHLKIKSIKEFML